MLDNEVLSGVLTYVFGGKAEFCILQEPASKFWFSIRKSKYKGVYFISGSSESARKLKYLGTMTCYDNNGQMYPLRYKLAKDADDKSDYLMNGLMRVLERGDNQNPKVHIIHNGRCSVCGRLLTDDESVKMGVGPTCIKKIFDI